MSAVTPEFLEQYNYILNLINSTFRAESVLRRAATCRRGKISRRHVAALVKMIISPVVLSFALDKINYSIIPIIFTVRQ